jgi:hypothetical protein
MKILWFFLLRKNNYLTKISNSSFLKPWPGTKEAKDFHSLKLVSAANPKTGGPGRI